MTPMNIIIAGVGGQGTVLASKIVAQAALSQGLQVRTAETIGMAQRGGSVLGHVRIGEAASPLVPYGAAQLLIGFEPAETVRALPYLAPGGTVVTAMRAIVPATATLAKLDYDGGNELDYLRGCATIGKLAIIDAEAICEQVGSARALNVALLGAVTRVVEGVPVLSADTLFGAVRALVKPRFLQMNEQAFALGVAQAV
jgi:indolepyruvate ferredoxin oxidoreductase beta subunit